MPVINAASGVKAGTIAHFGGSAAPAGWLKANGAAISRKDYAALFTAIGTTYGAGATNLILYSEQFDNAAWSSIGGGASTVVANDTAAPDGQITADKIKANAVAHEYHGRIQTYAITAGTAYTCSVYVKYSNHPFIAIRMGDTVTYPHVVFNIQNKTVTLQQAGITGTITDIGGGWLRLSATRTAGATTASGEMIVSIAQSGGVADGNWTPLGTEEFWSWGAQAEAGATVGPYSVTTAAPAGGGGFNVPDLRGEFIRSLDDGRGIDTGRTLGSAQGSQNLSHAHGAFTGGAGSHFHNTGQGAEFKYYGAGTEGAGATGPDGARADGLAKTSTAADHAHAVTVNADGGGESRPRNVALLPCIKY